MKPKIMVAIPVKNDAKYVERFLKTITSMDYPKNRLRFVFSYGRSIDFTLDIIKDFFKRSKGLKYEIYADPPFKSLLSGPNYFAKVMNELYSLLADDESYILSVDADVIKVPKNTLRELIKVNKDIVAPCPGVIDNGKFSFYDTYCFRTLDGMMTPYLKLEPNHPFFDIKEPVEMQCIGTMALIKAEVVRKIKWENPIPWLQFNREAIRQGFKVWTLPYLKIIHANVIEEGGEIHMPLEWYINKGLLPRSEYEKIREKKVESEIDEK